MNGDNTTPLGDRCFSKASQARSKRLLGTPQIGLATLSPTAPLTERQRQAYAYMIDQSIKQAAGNSPPFRLKEGDQVEDFFISDPPKPAGTVTELYRENGHNKIATEQGFFREQDLRKVRQ